MSSTSVDIVATLFVSCYNRQRVTRSDDKAARATLRSSWPGRKTTLDDSSDDDLSASTTAEDRLAMMWELSKTAWLLTGQPLPEYRREEMPGRIIHLRDL